MQIVTVIVAAGPMEGTPLIRRDRADRWEIDANARLSNGEETANGQ
jgi:hypothetical protein